MSLRYINATIYVERGDDELELTVSGAWMRAERDVGFGGGVDLDDRVWLDGKVWDGELTDKERERAEEAVVESCSEGAEDYREWDDGRDDCDDEDDDCDEDFDS